MSVTNKLDIDIKASTQKAIPSLDTMIAKLNEVDDALNRLNPQKIEQVSASIKGLKGVHVNVGRGGSGGVANTAEMSRTSKLFQLLSASSNGASKGILNFRGSMLKLAATWGTFYAAMYPAIRLFKFFGSKVQDSMDYVETYNYFLVTMNKIGHDSGDEFLDGFMGQVKDLDKKMTGFRIGENGELFETGEKSLGLDPNIIMQFQARVGAVTNSVGLLGETSVATQKALTMLSSDLSSLKNEDLESVMTNLSSGLIGQSRALYKYGIDITNATLKTYAYEHGVTKAVSAMTQAEKMQLRVLAILDQSKVAWGDQANTISSVANQYRIMKQQVSNLGRVIGNLFLPVVQVVLPYLNAFIIAMRKIMTLLGFKLYGNNWLSDLNEGISSGNFDGLVDDAEDLEDSLDGAGKSAKKLKQALMGFDELNIINPNESSGSGSGGGGASFDLSGDINEALAEYEKVWNEAFNNTTNKAEELANKFYRYVENKDFFGLGRWLSDGLADQLERIDWERAYAGAKDFGSGLANFLNGLISPRTFYDVGETIANSLNTAIYFSIAFGEKFDSKNFGNAIANGINGFFDNYDFAALAKSFNVWIDNLEDAFFSAVSKIKWKKVFKGLWDFVSNIELDTVVIAIGLFELKHLGKKLGAVGVANLFGTLLFGKEGSLVVGLKTLRVKILDFLAASKELGGFKNALAWALGTTPGNLTGTLATGFTLAASLAVALAITWDYKSGNSKKKADKLIGDKTKDKDIAYGLQTATTYSANMQGANLDMWIWSTIIGAIKNAKNNKDVQKESKDLGKNVYDGIHEGIKEEATNKSGETGETTFEQIKRSLEISFGIHSPAKNMYPIGNNIFLGIIEGFKEKYPDWFTTINAWYSNDVLPWFTKDKWHEIGKGIDDGLSTSWDDFSKWWKTTGIYTWWTEHVEPFFAEDKWTFDGIAEGLKKSFTSALNGVKMLWNSFADWINEKLIWDVPSVNIGDKTIGGYHIQLGQLPKFDIPQYRIGGFPEDGLFMANHNELVGQFSNGQTAVANNAQIVEGIREGVRSAVNEALAPYLREIADNTSETASNTEDIKNKPTQNLTNRDVAKMNQAGVRELGYALRT